MNDPRRSVLAVHGLTVVLATGAAIVEDVTLDVAPGEILGLVGESGSGKTTTALALLGYTRAGVRVAAGTVQVAGQEMDGRDERAARRLRGRLISYVPQDAGRALNPALRIGGAISDMLEEHSSARRGAASVESVLRNVNLPGTREFVRRFPHQLSGGQQQRVLIGIALVCEPPVVVLDEPTTGLDVVTQARVLDEVDRLRRERGLGMIYISHNLAVVSRIADRIAVMYAGRVVEQGPTLAVLAGPRHPYTRGLVAAIPDHVHPRRLRGMVGVAVGVGEWPAGCAFAPRCPQRVDRCGREMPKLEQVEPGRWVRCFEWQKTPRLEFGELSGPRAAPGVGAPLLELQHLRAVHGGRGAQVVAADDVSFQLLGGECVALVGESGSGKTTIARCIVGLHPPAAGRILLDGAPLAVRAKDRPKEARRRIQIVFQNPYDSLNPRHLIADAIARPARMLRNLSETAARAEVAKLLERVRLPVGIAGHYPGELSGGERQRVAIARALAAKPDLLVCDEVTSSLDTSVQAAVLELLAELRSELRLSLLFISHDLGVVAAIADRILVLEQGSVREQGTVGQVLSDPSHEYTRRLIAAAPRLPQLSVTAE